VRASRLAFVSLFLFFFPKPTEPNSFFFCSWNFRTHKRKRKRKEKHKTFGSKLLLRPRQKQAANTIGLSFPEGTVRYKDRMSLGSIILPPYRVPDHPQPIPAFSAE